MPVKLQKMIEDKQCHVGVIGLGYVGLPVSLAFAEAGLSTTGFDVDPEKIETLRAGESPGGDVTDGRIQRALEDPGFHLTVDMSRLEKIDVALICVPTPLRKSQAPDISHIVDAAESLVRHFEPSGMVILQSTTYPGTTREVLADKFSDAGWDLSEEVHLAYSPERIDPGNERYSLQNTPRVVGGLTPRAGEAASLLFEQVCDEVVRVSDPQTAETVKLLENIFRSINIGLANEMAIVCDKIGVDIWEVIDAASTKPYGFMPFYPGPGMGGHCIPIDPHFFSWQANNHNMTPRFIELADEINRSMPEHVLSKITAGLNESAKSVRGSSVCLYGVSYKANVSDTRESPAIILTRQLRELGANLFYVDPLVDGFIVDDEPVNSLTLDQSREKTFDADVILADHDAFEWKHLLADSQFVLDTRNALGSTEDLRDTHVVKL